MEHLFRFLKLFYTSNSINWLKSFIDSVNDTITVLLLQSKKKTGENSSLLCMTIALINDNWQFSSCIISVQYTGGGGTPEGHHEFAGGIP